MSYEVKYECIQTSQGQSGFHGNLLYETGDLLCVQMLFISLSLRLKTDSFAAGNRVQPAPSNRPSSPPTEPPPKPSKRLIILAECTWASDGDRNRVLKKLCEAMARDGLDEPFWIKKYLISPISQTVEESGADRCIQYKIHISRPKLERENPAAPEKPPRRGQQTGARPQQVGKS